MSHRPLRRALLVTTVLMCVMAAPALAQKAGKIAGRVVDATTGEALPAANVIVEGTNLGAAADLSGNYTILRVPPGVYTVRADYIGYQRMVISNLEVLTDLTTRAEFQLRPQALEAGEEVVVVAERPIVRKDLTSAEARVQAEEIARIPAQELGDIIDLQAGVVRDDNGGIHIRGGRSSEIAFMVNGIRITDDFTRTQSVQIDNESVQELQVISGTFNAEYGEAMSGIINVVTKTGGNRFEYNAEAWTGDYLSAGDDIFYNIDDIDPFANWNLRGSLSGPIIKDKVTFFATARRYSTDGYLYGINAFLPQGRTAVVNGDTVQVRGDSSAVGMNFSKRWSGQGSLEWRISTPFKLKLDVLASDEERGNYNHGFRLNPLGVRGDKERGLTGIANLTHVLSSKTFYELTASYKYSELTSNLFESISDPRYVHPDSLNTGANQFIRAGTDLGRFERSTESYIGKIDLTSQVSTRHQIKTGVELKLDKVFLDDFGLIPAQDADGLEIRPFQPAIPSREIRSTLDREPITFAAYLQDKIEYESLIINVGLRFDYFDSRGQLPADPEDPNIFTPFKLQNIYFDQNGSGEIELSEQRPDNLKTVEDRRQYWYRDASVKTFLSPRLGVGYPITDRGVIHFSYGIFTQLPDFEQLYRRDEVLVNQVDPVQGPFGNPDLKPQRTTQYELGLQQQLSDQIGADFTIYYKDIRDWISTGQPFTTAIPSVSYSTRINRDFGEVKGATLALSRRFADGWSFSVDYTFQVANGTNSTPEEEFFAQRGGAEPTRQLTALDWDQRHIFNSRAYVGGTSWGLGVSQRFNTGQPYSPELVTAGEAGRDIVSGLQKNSRRQPNQFTIDMNGFKDVRFGGLNLRLFFNVFNLLDNRNQINVFGDSGRSDFTLRQLLAGEADEGWWTQPYRYTAPRRLQVGISIRN